MKYDRALLENAVKTYKKITSRNFVLASKLSEKQISNAIKHIDKHIKPEDVVAFLDNTLFGSGKGGILLTTEKISCSDSSSSAAYFEKFIKAESSGDEVKVYYSENSFRRIKIKTYAEETASLLNTIAKIRLIEEKAALEKEAEELKKQEILIKSEAKISAKTEKKTAEKPLPAEKIEPAPEPEEKTYAWYFKKAFAGDIRAMLEIADICEEEGDYSFEEKWHEALFWNLRAAENENPFGAGKVGRMLENGIGIPINREKALEWYQKSPFHKNAYDNLKIDIESGFFSAVPDKFEYEEFVQWAGDYGELLYENGMGFDERFHGYFLIYISAMLGYPEAQFLLGKIYSEDSEMGKRDYKKEEYWIMKAYGSGCDRAAKYVSEHSMFLR